MSNDRPETAAGLQEKLDEIAEPAWLRGWVVVKWWKPLDARDPALASLGTGMMTLTVGRVARLEGGVLHIEAPEQTVDAPQPFTSAISVSTIIDMDLAGEQPVTDAMIRKLVHGDGHGDGGAWRWTSRWIGGLTMDRWPDDG
jgi:hypothetical protein